MLRLDLRTLLFFSALAGACTPKIGDKCQTSVDCSATGDRLCDITQPGGYCTIFNCEPGVCPEDSVCVNFGAEPSDVLGCATAQGASPYQRSFCMANCGSPSDCRGGYDCVTLGASNQWSAVVVDINVSNRVCMAHEFSADPSALVDAGPDAAPYKVGNAVCIGAEASTSDAEAGDSGPDGAGGEAGASSGQAGAGGMSGSSN
ncbi:MAG TPA: hypothetical protein VGI10_19915 [Polyangiaceae bacterium]|jgi:hypothetical protein